MWACSLAYKVTDWLTIGGGVNANYIEARLSNAQLLGGPPTFPQGSATVDGNDIGYGFSLGALFTVVPGTTVGIGYRSAITQNLQGLTNLEIAGGLPAATLAATAGLTLPDQVTGSFRSQINPQWTILGTVEWTNWSSLQQLVVVPAAGGPSILNLQWDDGWFFSGGVEYQWDPKLTLRAGLAYEISPVTDAYRTPRLTRQQPHLGIGRPDLCHLAATEHGPRLHPHLRSGRHHFAEPDRAWQRDARLALCGMSAMPMWISSRSA